METEQEMILDPQGSSQDLIFPVFSVQQFRHKYVFVCPSMFLD